RHGDLSTPPRSGGEPRRKPRGGRPPKERRGGCPRGRRGYARPARSGTRNIPRSYAVMRPVIADAATVEGEASHSRRGPLRPLKLRLIAETVTWSGRSETPGPQPMHAPQPGWITVTPARWNSSR